jgi:thermitase
VIIVLGLALCMSPPGPSSAAPLRAVAAAAAPKPARNPGPSALAPTSLHLSEEADDGDEDADERDDTSPATRPGDEPASDPGLLRPGGRAILPTWHINLRLRKPFVPHRLVVLFRDGVTDARIQAINQREATTVLRVDPDRRLYVLQLRPGVSPPGLARRYRTFPEVLAADPDLRLAAFADPDFAQQWYFSNTGNNPGNDVNNLGFIDADIDAPEGWLVSTGDPAIVIAILDTGLNGAGGQPAHPDLDSNKILLHANFSASTTTDDLYDHGTSVAGLAAAWSNGLYIDGTCPLCSLLNVKVLGDNGTGTLSDLMFGIKWAVKIGGARILNASLGSPGPCPKTLQTVINWALGPPYNAIFVAAAGNAAPGAAAGSNLNTSPVWPATCSGVVTVAATDARDDRASFSHYGAPFVSIAAPGVDVVSLASGGGVARGSGTSMAAPIVSGAMGVIWAQNPGFTNTMVINRMLQTADQIDGTVGFPGYLPNVNSWQSGRLNLCRALGADPCDPPPPHPVLPSLATCPPDIERVTLDLSTGVTTTLGEQDSRWFLTQVPSSTWNQLPGLYPVGRYPTFSADSQYWPDPPTGASFNWIQPLEDPDAPFSSRGVYKYRTQFSVPAGAYASVSVAGRLDSDDPAIAIRLNGAPVPWTASGGFKLFSASTGFIIGGVNELVVEVENQVDRTGLLVDAQVQATCVAFTDLQIRKAGVNLPWQVQGPGQYNIQVINFGPAIIGQGAVVVKDTLPPGFGPPVGVTAGSPWSCAVGTGAGPFTVTCTWLANSANVPVGALPLITVSGTLTAVPPLSTNCANVFLPNSGVVDPVPANNQDCWP